MATFISQDTDQPTPIICRFCDTELGERFHAKPTRVAAVHLRGQWAGGDLDVDPQWVPVCWEHDHVWDQDEDWEGGVFPEQYRLPKFDLTNWWVAIERERPDKDLVIGPYPNEDSARLAMEESLLVQGELEEGGTDCFIKRVAGTFPQTREIEGVLIDLDNPDYTGAPQPDDRAPIRIAEQGKVPPSPPQEAS